MNKRRRYPLELPPMGYIVQAPRVAELKGAYRPPLVPPGFEETRTPQGLSLVETIESSKGQWNSGSPYGRSIDFVYPANVDAPSQLVFGIDRQNGPPRARTLHFFRSDASVLPNVFPSTNAGVYAKVTYGIGGVQNSAFLDWGRGGNVVLTCDSLTVEAQQYAPADDTAYVPPDGFETLGCMLGHEGVSPARPPTFTTQRVNLANGDSISYPVPDFARWCYPVVTNIFAADVRLIFTNFGQFVTKRQNVTEDLITQGCAIPGGSSEATLLNNSGGAIAMLLQFELGL